jgi:hypothetical protein
MALPPGRKPLTDADMIALLQNMARSFGSRDARMEQDIRETADRLKQLSDFEIESLDPAERSWYYDGDGTRRPKSQADE